MFILFVLFFQWRSHRGDPPLQGSTNVSFSVSKSILR